MSQGKRYIVLLLLVLALSLPMASNVCAEVSVTAWSPKEMTLQSTCTTKEAAVRESVLWLLGGGPSNTGSLLPRDIYDTWRTELNSKCLGDPGKYLVSAAPRAEGMYVRLNLIQLVRDVVVVLFGETTPSVAVVTQEYILRRPLPPDPAVETEMLRAFSDYGFQLVDLDAAEEAEVRELMLQNADVGGTNAGVKLAAAMPADIIVTGESFAEETPRGDSFVARVELKVIETRTGRVLGAWAEPHQTVKVTAPSVAAKEALQRGTHVAAPRLAHYMLAAFGKPITRIRLNDVRSISDVAAVRACLQQKLPECQVRVAGGDTRGQKGATLEVTLKADTMEIALALEGMTAPRLLVDEIACRYIVARLR